MTIALAADTGDAHRDVSTMTGALADRAPAWAYTDNCAAALAVGGPTGDDAHAGLRALGNGIRLAIAGPAWVRAELDALARILDGPQMSPQAVAATLAGVTGDAHVAALLGGCVVVYRSAMSVRPLFYAITDDATVLVASQIRGIRAALPDTGIDLAGLAPFLVPSMSDPRGTAWRGIRRLPPGHALIIEHGRIRVREMPPVEALDIDGAHRDDLVAEFRRRLVTAVERSSGGKTDAVLLSGGIDSAALTCTATIADMPVRAFSLTYSSADLTACDERRYVDDVEQATGVPVTRLPADHLLPLLADYPLSDEPEAWTYAARNSAMLDHIRATDPAVSTVIAGEGGDELLLGQIFTVADRRARGDSRGADRELATFPDPAAAARIVDGLLTGSYDRHGARTLRAVGDIPPWLSDRYLADTGLIDRVAAGYPDLARPGQLTVDYSRTLVAEAGAAGRVHCGGWWEDTGRRAGLVITYPFLDPDLAALTWALPPQLLRDNGIEKVILREALAAELPASIAVRTDKADARAMMHTGLRRAADQLHAAAYGPLADHAVIDPAKLRTAVDAYLAGEDRHGPALWATVAVNTWMRHHEGDTPT